jgi:Domain of unknown function (DUF4864)
MQRLIFSILLIFSASGLTLTTRAADLGASEAKSVRAVIQSQLTAFAADDAARAFLFATPQLRQAFGSADNFMRMVRSSYPVVYRPATVAFLKPQIEQGTVVQAVHFTDGSGVLWLALYSLERQRDKRWRISGCQIVPAEGRAA